MSPSAASAMPITIPVFCIASRAAADVPAETLCLVYRGKRLAEISLVAKADGSDAVLAAGEQLEAYGCFVMPVSEWAANHADCGAAVLDEGSDADDDGRHVWWVSSLPAKDEG